MAVDHCYHFGSQLQLDTVYIGYVLLSRASRREIFRLFPCFLDQQHAYVVPVPNSKPEPIWRERWK